MDRRPPVRNDRRQILLGRDSDCVHVIYLAQSPIPQILPHCFSLSGCTGFATSEMHLCRDVGRVAPQVMIGLGLKIFQEKSKLRVRTPSRDGGGAIVATWAGLEASQNRPKWAPFGGLLPRFGPVLWGQRPTSGRSEAGHPSRPPHSRVGSSGRQRVGSSGTLPGPVTGEQRIVHLPPRLDGATGGRRSEPDRHRPPDRRQSGRQVGRRGRRVPPVGGHGSDPVSGPPVRPAGRVTPDP